jgi:prepilin-type processing-associated H-X9-DG protein
MWRKGSMNRNGTWLRKPDAAVTIVCIVLAVMSLGAVGEGGRRRAKEAVCRANLAQWGKYFQDYIAQNDGKFLTGCTDQGYYWPWQLPHDVQDWKKNRTWFCPMATQPEVNEQGYSPYRPGMYLFTAWGIFHTPASVSYHKQTYTLNPDGLCGSLGLNGYLLDIPLDERFGNAYQSGVPAEDGWRDLANMTDGDTVPMFLDCLRFEGWPVSTDPPAESQYAPWSHDFMARFCINRHEGAVNSLFVDGSVRKVGLKELWTLKWHKAFDTTGPWTKAGGVQSSDWPEWIRPFEDY